MSGSRTQRSERQQPMSYEVNVEVTVPMCDGAELATDVYLP
ncbi:hypothetical protein [Streptomyces hokutonensis]